VQSLFQQIKAGQLWDFHGGIHPPARKLQTQQKPIGRISLPERLYVPIRQHIGVAGTLLVEPGDYVLKGQPLTYANNAMAVPVHAPTSGTVLAITPHASAHPSALPEQSVVIVPDGLEQWRQRFPLDLATAERHELLARIQQAGIAGMGGAGFPTHLKTAASSGVDYLIINAVECEPYITADALLMQEYATTIVKGIDILCQLLQPAAVLIGIEDDKPDAIKAMQAATNQRDNYLVKVVPAKYPSGGEKQLIQLLTSKEVPAGRRPLDIGIVMQNVGTAFAIAQAVLDDIPLISRIVTVVGETLLQPQNIHALIGTPVGTLLDACGFQPEPAQRVIMGGPMMGFTLPSLQVPLVKTTNCILAPTQAELPVAGPELDCIRCGACAEVCPATLLPQQLLWYSKASDQEKLKEYNLADCIECGACAYVCPSEIPLVHYYRVAKAEIREQTREALKAEQAKARFEARNERLEREKQQRHARNQALAAQRQQQMEQLQKQRDVAEAQARVQDRLQDSHTSAESTPLTREQIIAAREQKKAEARAYQQAKAAQSDQPELASAPLHDGMHSFAQTTADGANGTSSSDSSSGASSSGTGTVASTSTAAAAGTNRNDAVAAAIARAKAKKAQQSLGNASLDDSIAVESHSQSTRTATVSDSVEATAHSTGTATDTSATDTSVNATAQSEVSVDPRAAAVAAAIARAKAKKAQQSPSTEASDESMTAKSDSQSNRTATVSDSVEATAHSTGTATDTSVNATAQSEVSVDPRAAAVAAAIARAKAKKAQQSLGNASSDEVDAVVPTNSAAIPETVLADRTDAGQSNTSQAVFAENVSEITSHDAKSSDVQVTASDAKSAAIAAAIARAKAKKAQQATEPKDPV
jgi:electron transport complex protein RnfC